MERLRGISEVFEGSEFDLVVYNVESLKRRQQHFLNVPRPDRADGVIVMSMSPSQADVESLKLFNLPVVLLDAEHASFSSMLEDSVAGGRMSAEHLIGLGHTRIGFIGGPMNDPFNFAHTPSTKRLQGYKEALLAAGIPLRDAYIGVDTNEVIGQGSLNTSRELAAQLTRLPEPVTAIVCASDTHAFGVLQAARELGLHVPHDLSVVGYDDTEAASYLELTSVSQSLYDTGKRSAERMLQLLAGDNAAPVFERLPNHIVVRKTTAAPKFAATNHAHFDASGMTTPLNQNDGSDT